MTDSPERSSLQTLTENVIKTINKLNEAVLTEPDARRRSKLRKIVTELDTHNDDAMRSGLGFDAGYIVRLKTGRVRMGPEGSGVKKETRPRDSRVGHAALQAVREVIGKYPHKDVWDLVIKTVGDEPDIERMRECFVTWRSKNYSPQNLAWLTDWYRNGTIGNTQLRLATKADRSVDAAKQVAAEFRNGTGS